MLSDEPIFIVGAPRSGTTLLTAMLGAHERLDAGPETQFFEKISKYRLYLCVHDFRYPKMAVETICTLRHEGEYVIELFDVSRRQIEDYLKAYPPSVAAMLESITQNHCLKNGKQRWIEKTPNHVQHLDYIRKQYPKAQVIRILRDPRDSVLSMSKLPWASASPIPNAFEIQKWYLKSKAFFETDSNCFTFKYEDLMASPQETLKSICQFLGESYSEELLDTRQSGKSVSSKNEPWKNQVSSGLDASRVYPWKREEDQSKFKAVSACCNSFIKEFGYENEVSYSKAYVLVYSSILMIEENEARIRNWVDQGYQIGLDSDLEQKEYIVLFASRFRSQIKTLFYAYKCRLKGNRIHHFEKQFSSNPIHNLMVRILLFPISRFRAE